MSTATDPASSGSAALGGGRPSSATDPASSGSAALGGGRPSSAPGTERRRLAVRLLTPEGPVFDGVAYMVVAPSVQGEVGILPRHTPFIAFLRMGETRIKLLDDTEQVFATTEGYLSVEEDRVLVLVEQAERAEEIDYERARAALERAEADLAAAGDDEVKRIAAESARRRAENRLAVVSRG